MGILRAHPLLYVKNNMGAAGVFYSLCIPRFWYNTLNLISELIYSTHSEHLL